MMMIFVMIILLTQRKVDEFTRFNDEYCVRREDSRPVEPCVLEIHGNYSEASTMSAVGLCARATANREKGASSLIMQLSFYLGMMFMAIEMKRLPEFRHYIVR